MVASLSVDAHPDRGLSGAPEGSGEDPASFLVLEGRLEQSDDGRRWTLKEDPCPLAGYSAVDRTTGEIAWSSTCNSARCARCSRIVSARSFALARAALKEMNPAHIRYVTLTLAPDDWDELRQRMKDLVRFLRGRGIAVKWLWVVERGSDTGMKHVHAVQWGDFIPWQDLLGWWGARVEIKAGHKPAMGYLSKNVVRYLGKGIDGERDQIEDHMNLNGGRAAHWSRGFYNGLGRDAFAQAHPMPGIYFLQNHPTGGVVLAADAGGLGEAAGERGQRRAPLAGGVVPSPASSGGSRTA